MNEELPITAETKVAALLARYPELEDVLIAMAPPFKKLKNPILRGSVAKVASLRQAAMVGRLPVEDMVNQLRAAVGQASIVVEQAAGAEAYYTEQPDWFDAEFFFATIGEKHVDPDVMTLNPVIRRASKLADGEILELVTDFLPVPGIDLMRQKGFRSWCREQGKTTQTYFSRQSPQDSRPGGKSA